MKKRALLVALAAAMAASLAGCGGSSASSTTAAGSAAESSEAAGNTAADASGKDSLVIVTSSDVLSMDPYRYDEGPTNQIKLHIYEAMVDQNADMSFGPCLAESWENSEDGKTWTFKIREGVKFSNGDDMTPEMVMASIQRTVDKSDRVPEFFDLDSMEVDGQNLIFHLNRANANMAGSLADPLFLIVDTNVDD